MALPADALQTGGIIAVAIAALKLVEIFALRIFSGSFNSNAAANAIGNLELVKIREIIAATDQEGALLVYYPRKVFNVVEGLARDMHKLQIAIDHLSSDINEISKNSARTVDAVRTCESLNRMKEHQAALEQLRKINPPPTSPPLPPRRDE